jgi:hypothetical protein
MQKHPSSIQSLTIAFISETNANAPKAISAPKCRLGVPDVLVNGGGADGGRVEALVEQKHDAGFAGVLTQGMPPR